MWSSSYCTNFTYGEYSMIDLYLAGGIPDVLKTLDDEIDNSPLTVTWKIIGENLRNAENKTQMLFIH